MSKLSLVVGVVALIAIGSVLYIKRSTWMAPSPQALDQYYSSASPSPLTTSESMPQESFVPSVSFDQVTPIAQTVKVTMKTNKGDIAIDLDGAVAPVAVGNFVYLAKQHFYDGVTFHRVIPDFMIQAGDPLSKDASLRARHGTGGPGYVFKNEDNSRKFVRGSLGMANAGRDTNGSQFFIVTGKAFPQLDGGYTNFGTVTSGMEVVDAISQVQTDERDNPLEVVVINEVVIHE